jgi:hypothetical protein
MVEMWFGDFLHDWSDTEELTAEFIKEYVYDLVENDVSLTSGSFAADCVTGILRAVDWEELAKHHQPEGEDLT